MAIDLGNLAEIENLEPETTKESFAQSSRALLNLILENNPGLNMRQQTLAMVEANAKNRRVYVTGLETRVEAATHEAMIWEQFARFGEIEEVLVPYCVPTQLCLGMPQVRYPRDIAVCKGVTHILFRRRHAAYMASGWKMKINNQEIVCLQSSL